MASRAGMRFVWTSKRLDARLAELPQELRARFAASVDIMAPKAEAIMKERAPWTQTGAVSRWGRISTGEARQGLYAYSEHRSVGTTSTHTIRLGQRYSGRRWLEIAMSGRFAIIVPTRNAVGKSLMVSFNGMLDNLVTAQAAEIVAPDIGLPSGAQVADSSVQGSANASVGHVMRTLESVWHRSPNTVRRIGWSNG